MGWFTDNVDTAKQEGAGQCIRVCVHVLLSLLCIFEDINTYTGIYFFILSSQCFSWGREMEHKKVGLPITCGLKHNLLDLAFKALHDLGPTFLDLQSTPRVPQSPGNGLFLLRLSLPCSFLKAKHKCCLYGVLFTTLRLPLHSMYVSLISLPGICYMCLPTWLSTPEKHDHFPLSLNVVSTVAGDRQMLAKCAFSC